MDIASSQAKPSPGGQGIELGREVIALMDEASDITNGITEFWFSIIISHMTFSTDVLPFFIYNFFQVCRSMKGKKINLNAF